MRLVITSQKTDTLDGWQRVFEDCDESSASGDCGPRLRTMVMGECFGGVRRPRKGGACR